MEELLAYANLMGIISNIESMYEEKLNELFILNPNDENLLELEFLSGNIKESIIYIRNNIDYNTLDHKKFGKEFINLLKPVYESMEIHSFGRCMYNVWKNLDDSLQDEEPFFALCYADDPLSYGDEKQTREIYTKLFSYYDD